jgi:hypothetical protein
MNSAANDELCHTTLQAMDLRGDVESFLSPGARELFRMRLLPYQRCYLLYGPPGNGKSSILQALSIKFKLKLYFLKVTKLMTKTELQSLLTPLTKVWCAVFGRILHSRMCVEFTVLLGLKPGHTCDLIAHLWVVLSLTVATTNYAAHQGLHDLHRGRRVCLRIGRSD